METEDERQGGMHYDTSAMAERIYKYWLSDVATPGNTVCSSCNLDKDICNKDDYIPPALWASRWFRGSFGF